LDELYVNGDPFKAIIKENTPSDKVPF